MPIYTSKSLSFFLVFFISLMFCGPIFSQTNVKVSSAGWKKLAYTNVVGSRGFGKLSLYVTGGTYAPQYVDIHWFKDWKDNTGIKVESNSNHASYWKEARLTYTADTVFIEVNFIRAIDGNLVTIVDPYGWNPVIPYSGILPTGGSQTIGKSVKITRMNIHDQFIVGFNGFIGIGTNTPKEALSVNGNIRAKEIKVETTGWPDYVFDQGYRLKSLQEIENFIRLNGHLPDMPTAKLVEKEGISLGEMNKLLLKQIEELTLHLIEKDKQIDAHYHLIKQRDKNLLQIEDRLRKLEMFVGSNK